MKRSATSPVRTGIFVTGIAIFISYYSSGCKGTMILRKFQIKIDFSYKVSVGPSRKILSPATALNSDIAMM